MRTMQNNHQWQHKQKRSIATPVTTTNSHHDSSHNTRGEGVKKKDFGNVEESHPHQQPSSRTTTNPFFGRSTDRSDDRSITAPPMSLDSLVGSTLLRGIGNGSVGSDNNNTNGIERKRGGGGHPHPTHQETWGAASSADNRIFANNDGDGGGSYNSLGSLDPPQRVTYDFGNEQITSANRSTSSPLIEMMASHVPPGLVGGHSSKNSATSNTMNNNHQNMIPSSDSSSTHDYDVMGMRIPARPASTGLIGHSQHKNQQQQQHYQHNTTETHRNRSPSPSVMGSLGIQFGQISGVGGGAAGGSGGAGAGGLNKPKSIMDWIQEDFPRTSSPEYTDVGVPINPHATNTMYGEGRGVTHASGRSAHDAQHYASSPMVFDNNHRSSQGVMAPYDVHAQPYKPASLSYDTMPHMPQNSQQQQQHNSNATYNQLPAHAAHLQPMPSMGNNTHHYPHHILPLPNYDQPPPVYYDGNEQSLEQNRGSLGDKQRPSTVANPPPPHPPQVIQTTATSATGNAPPHHHPPPPHAIYLNSVPAYGGYTTVYHHGPPPHPHHHSHHHPYSTLSNPPQILHTAPSTSATAALDPNMVHHSNLTSASQPLNSEYISLPAQQTNAGGMTNGTYVYLPPHGHALSHHPHHHPPPTVAVVDSNGRPTTIAISTSAPPPLSSAMNKQQQHGRKGGEVGNFNAVSKHSGRKSIGQRGAKKVAGGGGGLDKDSVDYVSTLLEDFHLGKSRSWTIHDVKGEIVEFCQDQNGSRFIQQRLEIASDAERLLVLSEVLPSVQRLRNDVFGNYVVQKLFDHGNNEIKSELKSTLEGEMLSLSTQMYGCRVVQKALECVEEEDLLPLLKEFRGHVITCIHDQNGNHVIQKCIEVISKKVTMLRQNGGPRHENDENGDVKNTVEQCKSHGAEQLNYFEHEMQLIVNCVLGTAANLSCHPYGCRVLQRILEHCTDDLKTRALDTIRKSHRVLLDDQYGNYVIQHVLQFGRDDDRDSILGIVVESGLLELSRQKFASNVVEKLLKYGNGRMRNRIVREMLKVVEGKGTSASSVGGVDGTGNGKNNGSSVVLLMVRDAYANYVVQTTLDVVPEGEEKILLLEELNRNSALLRNYTFAKHIVTKLGTNDVSGG